MTWIWKDLRHAARLLVRRPGSSAAAILAFALGIGPFTAQYSVVHRGLQGLPFKQADRLIHLERNNLSEGITLEVFGRLVDGASMDRADPNKLHPVVERLGDVT